MKHERNHDRKKRTLKLCLGEAAYSWIDRTYIGIARTITCALWLRLNKWLNERKQVQQIVCDDYSLYVVRKNTLHSRVQTTEATEELRAKHFQSCP